MRSLGRIAAPSTGLIVIGLVLVAALINPIGFVGGGNDDWQYLDAARCWAAHGPCLPHDHWTTRWPLIAPTGGALALLGDSRTVVELVALLFALAAVVLLGLVVRRIANPRAALLAVLLFVTTPIVQQRMLKPNVDMPELLFLLGALYAWLVASSDGKRRWAAIAGLCLALAFATRETALVYLPCFGLAFLLAPAAKKLVLFWSVPAFLSVIAAEMAISWAAAGDALLRWRLALSHGLIPSDALAAGVDRSRSPLLNPDFIGGWEPASGLDLHWSVSGVANLLASPQIGAIVVVAVILLLLARRQAGLVPARTILAGAALAALLLIYVLAIDPQPRSFLPLAAAAAVAAAIAAEALWRAGERMLALLPPVLAVAAGLWVILAVPTTRAADPAAAEWIRTAPGRVTLSETSRRNLAFVPEAQRLPVNDPAAPHRLAITDRPCGPAADRAMPLRNGGLAGLFAGPDGSGHWLCLLRQ